jgi:hypothetical protein
MRIVRSEEELGPAVRTAANGAAAAFKNGDIYVEKYAENARHIEVLAYRPSQRPSSALSTACPLRWLIRSGDSAATVSPIHGLHHRGDEADERDIG